MAGSKEGGLKAAATNKKRHGDDFYVRMGVSGGKVGRTGGFYANRDLARKAGAKGGRISRRGKDTISHQDILKARVMYLNGESMAGIARQLKISYSSVRYAIGRK